MDVNLTISLIRGQMGTVIEKAVTVAVETVLGEMMKVVSIKFDEFRKEMNAKDKENENIRQMLEISRCQMKAMRKYMSAPTAKDDRPSQVMQRQQVSQFDLTRVPEVYIDQSTPQPISQGRVSNGLLCRRTVNNQTSAELRNRGYSHRPPLTPEANSTTLHKTSNSTTEPVSTEDPTQSDVCLITSDGTTLLTSIKQEIAHSPEPDCSLQEVGESCDALHSRRQDMSGSSDSTDPQHLSPVQAEEDPSATSLSRPAPALKEEEEKEEEVQEVVSIKQEPYEVEVEVEGDLLLAGSEEGEMPNPGGYQEGTGTQQITATYYPSLSSSSSYASQSCLPMNSVSTVPASAAAPGSSLASACSGSGVGSSAGGTSAVVRQVAARPWLRDLNLYEQYKQARSELRRRNQLRRKQVEQDLPQALLADLVKERREKTRLRVARWRAKRKLQACLMNAQQQSPGAVTAAVAAAAAASAAAAQAGLSERRMTSGLRMQMGVAGQQQRLGRQTQQQQQQQQQQGRAGLQFGGRVGRAYPSFGAGTQHGGLPAVNMASGQTYGAGGRFAAQRATTYTQRGSQGANAGMYQ